MDKSDIIIQKIDELSERLDTLATAPFVKVKKKRKPESGRRDYRMAYKNSEGAISQRDINITKVTAKDGKVNISAYCFESDAPKSFVAGNIISLEALPDGEKLQTYADIIQELSEWVV